MNLNGTRSTFGGLSNYRYYLSTNHLSSVQANRQCQQPFLHRVTPISQPPILLLGMTLESFVASYYNSSRHTCQWLLLSGVAMEWTSEACHYYSCELGSI